MPMLSCSSLNMPFFLLQLGPSVPLVSVPSAEDFQQGIFRMGLPQLPLTTLSSVVAVAELARQLFPERDSRRFRPSRFALSVGVMNLVGCWFGALPTCHGAGGMAAQVRWVTGRDRPQVKAWLAGRCHVLLQSPAQCRSETTSTLLAHKVDRRCATRPLLGCKQGRGRRCCPKTGAALAPYALEGSAYCTQHTSHISAHAIHDEICHTACAI